MAWFGKVQSIASGSEEAPAHYFSMQTEYGQVLPSLDYENQQQIEDDDATIRVSTGSHGLEYDDYHSMPTEYGQQGIEYIQESRRSRQPDPQMLEYEDPQGIEYIQESRKSQRPDLQVLEYEDQHGIEYIQGMEYIRPSMRSRCPDPDILEYEDKDFQGIEYIQERRRSRRPDPQMLEYEDPQGIEYIQESRRSKRPDPQVIEYEDQESRISKRPDPHVIEYEDQQGIEYIQESRISRPDPRVIEYDQLGIECIQGRRRSKRTDPQALKYEDQQGSKRSTWPYPQVLEYEVSVAARSGKAPDDYYTMQIEHNQVAPDYKNQQGIEDIRSRIRSFMFEKSLQEIKDQRKMERIRARMRSTVPFQTQHLPAYENLHEISYVQAAEIGRIAIRNSILADIRSVYPEGVLSLLDDVLEVIEYENHQGNDNIRGKEKTTYSFRKQYGNKIESLLKKLLDEGKEKDKMDNWHSFTATATDIIRDVLNLMKIAAMKWSKSTVQPSYVNEHGLDMYIQARARLILLFEHIQARIRSIKYPGVLGIEYEEFTEEIMRSVEASEYEKKQGIEHIVERMRSTTKYGPQSYEHEDHKGIEYIQEKMRTVEHGSQSREYEAQQRIEHILERIRLTQNDLQ